MSVESIILAINRLVSNYCPDIGQKAREEKIRFFSEYLKNYTEQQIDNAVMAILHDENIKRFPTLAQIKNHITRNIVHIKHNDCDHCQNGCVPVWQLMPNGLKYCYTYACHACAAGRHVNLPILPTEYRAIPYKVLIDGWRTPSTGSG